MHFIVWYYKFNIPLEIIMILIRVTGKTTLPISLLVKDKMIQKVQTSVRTWKCICVDSRSKSIRDIVFLSSVETLLLYEGNDDNNRTRLLVVYCYPFLADTIYLFVGYFVRSYGK